MEDTRRIKTKILFMMPPFLTEEVYGKFAKSGSTQPFLGICYLAATLRKLGYLVDILDCVALNYSINNILDYIQDTRPQIIGLTVKTVNSHRAIDAIQKIKNRFSNIKIIVGGPHLNGYYKQMAQIKEVDFGVIGEGERTIVELCDHIIGIGKEKKDIPGIAYYQDEEVRVNQPRPLIDDLDSIPFPARDLLPSLDYYCPSVLYHKRSPVMQMFTSRGCPAQCIFCNTPFGKSMRYHSPEYVIEEMQHLIKDFGVREILINDDTFVIKKDRIYSICERIKREKLDIIWSCNVRVNLVDKEILKEMKSAGCWLIMPGVESGDQNVLDFLKKGITVEQVKRCCQWAHEVGISVKPSFIIGNPTDTEETIRATIRLAKSLKTHYPSFTMFTPFPGTPSWDIVDNYGYTDKSNLEKFALSSESPSFIPHGLSEKKLIEFQKKGFYECYFNLGMIWRHIKTIQSITDIKKFFNAFLTLLKL